MNPRTERDDLFQGRILDAGISPMWMLVACILVRNSRWNNTAEHVWEELYERGAPFVQTGDEEELRRIISPLGHVDERFTDLRGFVSAWQTDGRPKTWKGLINYPGLDQYAIDSWRLFIHSDYVIDPYDDELAAFAEWQRGGSVHDAQDRYRFCWYTGIDLTKQKPESSNAANALRKTREHLMPKSSGVHRLISTAGARRNIVAACAFINHSLGSMPLGAKIMVRERILQSVNGKQQLSNADVRRIKRIIRRFKRSMMIKGVSIFTNVNTQKKANKVWSVSNHEDGITDEDIDRRNRKLRRIFQIEDDFAYYMLGICRNEELRGKQSAR